MSKRRKISLGTIALGAIIAALLLSVAAPCQQWLSPDWGSKEPQFPPGSLYWHKNKFKTCPILYRTVLTLPDKPIARAGAYLDLDWYAYVYVNGQLVKTWMRPSEDKPHGHIPLDLTPYLRPGKNVIVISATSGGLALNGLVQFADGTSQPILSRAERWRVQKFPPLTNVELHPCQKPEFDDSQWFAVAGREFSTKPPDLVAICAPAELERMDKTIAEAQWRLELLAQKGIVVDDWEAFGFAGAYRLPQWITDTAARALKLVGPASDALAKAREQPLRAAGKADGEPGRRHRAAARAVGQLADMTEALTLYVRALDESNNYANHLVALRLLGEEQGLARLQQAAHAARQVLPRARAELEKLRGAEALRLLQPVVRRLKQAKAGLVVNDLNTAVSNPFGWIDTPRLLDSNPTEWGVNINPPTLSWKMNLDGKWRFRTDPENVGLEEARHTFGYNIENQWQELNVPGSWERQGIIEPNPKATAQSPYPGVNEGTDGPYNGFAWYRKTLKIPEEWAGNDLELYISAVDDWDWAYFNGKQIGHTGAKTKRWWAVPRQYKIPKELVHFGGYNAIALRVYDCRGTSLVGHIELRCPALKDAFEKRAAEQAPRTKIYLSPLSPAALLTVGGTELTLWGWGARGSKGPTHAVMFLGGQQVARKITGALSIYDVQKDGPLSENWLLLWLESAPGLRDLPIELVFVDAPKLITANVDQRGVSQLTVRFAQAGAQVFAIRPLRGKVGKFPGHLSPEQLKRLRFWSRACLAYPTSYTEVERPARDGPKALDVVDVYNYRIFRDAWGTEPLRIAPLPPLASFALRTNYPGVRVPEEVRRLEYDMGEWGEFRACLGREYIRYRIPRQRFPRFGGFTSFCFSGVDIGVPGNIKEIEAVAATGANSYRPQHNQRGEAAKRMVAWCVERGIQHCFNIDNRLGNSEQVYEHYRTIAQWCKDYPAELVAYDLINEPANMPPDRYNPVVKKLTEIIRSIDKKHLIYIETPHSFASVDQFVNLEVTGDPLTVYSFHDYDYRLPPRWPNLQNDIRNIVEHWLPAIKFSIEHHVPIHLGEFGGFEQTKNDPFNNRCAETMMLDFFKLFDQFRWHWHYYSLRGTVRPQPDGSLRESYVEKAHRRYFARGTFNRWTLPLKPIGG